MENENDPSGGAPREPPNERELPTRGRSRGDDARSRPLWSVYAIFAGVGLIAVGLFAAGAALSNSRGDLPFEVAKAGAQLFAIVLLGGAATYAFGELNGRREQRREIAAEVREEGRKLDAYRAQIAGELISAYHRTKAVRRTLRAAGFEPPVSGAMTVEQRAEFWEQLKLLNACQLTLEKVSRDIEGQPEVYGADSGLIKSQVDGAETHVNKIIADWEKHGRAFTVDADLGTLMKTAENLRLFLLGAGVKQDVANPIADAARRIHALRLRGRGNAREDTVPRL
jgi:hypothetical protein